ncbi:hypothetical protein ACUL41_07030 [Virgibacillus natechei]
MKSLFKFINNLFTGKMDKKHDEVIQTNLKELRAYEPSASKAIQSVQEMQQINNEMKDTNREMKEIIHTMSQNRVEPK